jgi:hypothetical protein
MTGTADRKMYDYGFKQVQISGRKENYWARDCGWWYVTGSSGLNITVKDGAGDSVYNQTGLSTTKGRHTATINWGSDDDPGEWTATVDDGTTYAIFKFFVRGALQVDSIGLSSSTPSTGSLVTLNATIKDNAGNLVNGSAVANNGTSVPIGVTAYVTGAGENFVLTLYDDGSSGGDAAVDGVWTNSFTPNAMGDHKVKIRASDNRSYWVDGSGSTFVSVGGTFPYASMFLSFVERLVGGFSGSVGFSSVFTSLAGLGGWFALKRSWNRG